MSYEAARTGQPFEFTKENLKQAQAHIAKYPAGRQKSAVMPLLDLAQRQNDGWISQEAIEYVAKFLNMPPIKVHEVASFYTMYNLQPVGEYLVQVCHTTPCWLRGADTLVAACESHLKISANKETTADGKFTLMRVECLGACANAPVVQINDDYYEDLDVKSMKDVLNRLKKGEAVACGSQTGRKGSSPALPAKTAAPKPAAVKGKVAVRKAEKDSLKTGKALQNDKPKAKPKGSRTDRG